MASILCILDGWGVNQGDAKYDAIHHARTPHYDRLIERHPNNLLRADGMSVGLPSGNAGNSEVGHMTIGAGRPVRQQLNIIRDSMDNIAENPVIIDLIKHHKGNIKARCHLVGMVSDGGVHSHIDYIEKIAIFLSSEGIGIEFHVITDGRDVPPRSVKRYLQRLQKSFAGMDINISSISGRYYAMDRDKRWNRTEAAARAIVLGHADRMFASLEWMVDSFYQNGTSDEFFPPSIRYGYSGVRGIDTIFMLNFRADRLQQIMSKFEDVDCEMLLSMFNYEGIGRRVRAVLSKERVGNTLNSVLHKAGKRQFRLAETEKYAHATFFLDCGESIDDGDGLVDRLMIKSPSIDFYDSKPEMSAYEVTDVLIEAIDSKKYDFIFVNYANADMIGHTGNMQAAVEAVEALDHCLGRIVRCISDTGDEMLITADHGNVEKMFEEGNDQSHTAHTVNPVPIIYVGGRAVRFSDGGELGNIANTVLYLMGLEQCDDFMPNLLNEGVE